MAGPHQPNPSASVRSQSQSDHSNSNDPPSSTSKQPTPSNDPASTHHAQISAHLHHGSMACTNRSKGPNQSAATGRIKAEPIPSSKAQSHRQFIKKIRHQSR
ncbi:hypothetical protein ACLOJK_029854 [Asimina triloba]